MIKRLLTIILSLMLLLAAIPVLYASDSAPAVFLDGNRLEFEVEPRIVDGSTLVPLRKIFESLGAKVDWAQETETVTATKVDTVITYKIGDTHYTKDGKTALIPVAGRVIDGSTLVPLRFVGEALGATVGWEGNSSTITISSAVKKKIAIDRVVDGDTVEVSWDGKTEKIRLIGVDTPESVHPDAAQNNELGKTASEYSKKQLEGRTVLVEVDVEERDKYGRILGYAYFEDGTFYNGKLVADGYAKVATYPPNVRWVELFKHLQTDARESIRGFWAAEELTPIPTPTSKPAQPTPTPTSIPDNVSYKSCAEVKAAGKAPLYKGDPGYSTKLDRDGDGIACE